MKYLLIVLLFSLCTLAARKSGGVQSYTKYVNESGLFIKSSFGIMPKCKLYDGIRRHFLINIGYSVDAAKNYDVEHIIDKKHSMYHTLDACDKNIYGNLILANSSWNRALGLRTWKWVKMEKEIVYGNIFTAAKHNVKRCCKTPAIVYVPTIINGIILAILLCIAIGVAISYLSYKLTYDPTHYILFV